MGWFYSEDTIERVINNPLKKRLHKSPMKDLIHPFHSDTMDSIDLDIFYDPGCFERRMDIVLCIA